MRERLRDFKCYRPRPPRGASPRPAVILLNGPPPPADWPTLTFDLASNADLAGRIALESLAKHFIKREATVHHTRFALFCVWSVEDHDNARIRLFSGLRVKAHRPSAASKPGIAVNWEVEARFTASLADELLRSACQHLGVSLRYYGDEWRRCTRWSLVFDSPTISVFGGETLNDVRVRATAKHAISNSATARIVPSSYERWPPKLICSEGSTRRSSQEAVSARE